MPDFTPTHQWRLNAYRGDHDTRTPVEVIATLLPQYPGAPVVRGAAPRPHRRARPDRGDVVSGFEATHTWHFLGDDIPVIVRHDYGDGCGVVDEHGTPYLALEDELTARLTEQERYDVRLEKRIERAVEFDS